MKDSRHVSSCGNFRPKATGYSMGYGANNMRHGVWNVLGEEVKRKYDHFDEELEQHD